LTRRGTGVRSPLIRDVRRKCALTKATQEDPDVVASYAMAKLGVDLRSAMR
jgi:hypothetical protein